MGTPLIVDVQGMQVVFGLDWLPLVGAHPSLIARDLARRHGATHSVLSGRGTVAVGLARLASGMAPRGRLLSGAQAFSGMYATGTVAAVVDLEGQGWCVLAVHDGTVLARADRVHDQYEQACRALDDLRQAYPRLRRLGAADGADPAPSLAQLASAALDSARLRRVPHRWLRGPILWGGALLGAVLAGSRFVALYAGGPDSAPAERSPAEVWAQAQNAVLQGHRLSGKAGARILLETFYGLPVTVHGWSLRQARCTAQGAGLACQADYVRVMPMADNRGLLRGAHPEWKVRFPSVDQAQVDWFMRHDAVLVSRADLPDAAHHDTDWISALQAIRPAFARVQVDPSRPVPVPAPRGVDGQPLVRPPDLPRYATRALRIAGPLRAAGLLVPLSTHVTWTRAALTISAPRTGHSGTGPLNLTLDGVIYEIQAART